MNTVEKSLATVMTALAAEGAVTCTDVIEVGDEFTHQFTQYRAGQRPLVVYQQRYLGELTGYEVLKPLTDTNSMADLLRELRRHLRKP